jgi:peptidoglycan hydrolase CwlO-like protein
VVSLKRRVESLEARAPGGGLPPVTGTAAEIREIDREIARLEREIAEREVLMGPEELEEWHRKEAERLADFEARTAGLSLDEKIGALDQEIAERDAEIARIDAEVAALEGRG